MLIKIYGKYSSEDEEISHNGTMLTKIGLNYEQIKFNVSFDLCIELVSRTKFTGTITLDLPAGNIIQEGVSKYEKTDFSDIIFKRS